MEDTSGKYIRLFGTIFFTFIGFIVSMVLLLLCIRLFFGALSYLPWISYVYMVFILSVPAAVFIAAFLIFFKRTRIHPSKPIRWVSYSLFTVVLLAWGYIYITDLVSFFRNSYNDVSMYMSFDMVFLFSNVALIFFIGVMQALTTAKEKDWIEKHNARQPAE